MAVSRRVLMSGVGAADRQKGSEAIRIKLTCSPGPVLAALALVVRGNPTRHFRSALVPCGGGVVVLVLRRTSYSYAVLRGYADRDGNAPPFPDRELRGCFSPWQSGHCRRHRSVSRQPLWLERLRLPFRTPHIRSPSWSFYGLWYVLKWVGCSTPVATESVLLEGAPLQSH